MSIKAMSDLVAASYIATRDILTNAHMLYHQGRAMSDVERATAWQEIRYALDGLNDAFNAAYPYKADHQGERVA